MSAVALQIDMSDLTSRELRVISDELAKPEVLHAAIAGAAENWIKETGAEIAAGQHATAASLGANPTGHLAKAYEQIESHSDESGASLLVPGASRLAAAFGDVHVEPGPGKKYLTIAVDKDAYGKRAGEFDDLFVVKKGPEGRQRLFLARDGDGEFFQTMYALVPEATIPEDSTLIPFDDLAAEAADAAEGYLDALIESGKGGPA